MEMLVTEMERCWKDEEENRKMTKVTKNWSAGEEYADSHHGRSRSTMRREDVTHSESPLLNGKKNSTSSLSSPLPRVEISVSKNGEKGR